MKKLHSFAFYALVTPVITLAASTALAQQPAGQDANRDQQTTQRGQDTTPSTPASSQSGQATQRDNPAIAQGSRPVGQGTPTNPQADQSAQRPGQSSATPQAAGQSTQRATPAAPATPVTAQGAQSSQRGSAAAQVATGRDSASDRMEHRGYLNTAPARGMQVSELMGAEVSTSGDEDIGSIDELIIDENGQIVAIVVGVGGFLGMAEKNVAIGWGHITRTGTADDQELKLDVTREELTAAPEFERDE